jgi:hypothetical protein
VPPNRPVRPFKKITKDNPRKLKNAEYWTTTFILFIIQPIIYFKKFVYKLILSKVPIRFMDPVLSLGEDACGLFCSYWVN